MSYFYCLNRYLHTGAPVYFVVKDGFDYTTQKNQNKVCCLRGFELSRLPVTSQYTEHSTLGMEVLPFFVSAFAQTLGLNVLYNTIMTWGGGLSPDLVPHPPDVCH